MQKIQLLDSKTINKIAAGEVVESPKSVVKELAENAIDAGASIVSVEIREGGVSLIRVTDNGCGIPKEQVKNAFLRHATSKMAQIEDLESIFTLGFRGEALASIAAVAQVELVTKTAGEDTGTKICISGGEVESIEDTACLRRCHSAIRIMAVQYCTLLETTTRKPLFFMCMERTRRTVCSRLHTDMGNML